MRNGKPVLCNEQLQLEVSVGVARHSVVGATVYEASLRAHSIKKPVKRTKESSLFTAKSRPKESFSARCQEETKKECGRIKVTETTAEIVCIVCKDGASARPNEIVLCDKCGVGYHQKCHNPAIADKALEPEEPWMCTYCTNGFECPYLLNPFETKLREEFYSARKSSEDTKDNYYNTSNASGIATNKESRVTKLMANYYHDTYKRRTSMETSPVKHVPREAHHVMNRRAMIERPRSKYYKYPDERQRVERENAEFRKRRVEKPRDVWDNGGYAPTSRDVTATAGDDDSKLKAKDGPREKQRLTQDLERQRKKLREDMKRGKELQREHSQLLTRDQMPDQSRDSKNSSRDHDTEGVPTNDQPYDNWKYDRPQYRHNGTVDYSENIWNASEKQVHGDFEAADVRVNGAESKEGRVETKLDPCDCEQAAQEPGEHLYNMSNTQCEHSSYMENHHKVNGHADDAQDNHEHDRNTRGNHEYAREGHEHGNSEVGTKEVYTSEKIEVIGESTDLSEYNEADNNSTEKASEKVEEKRRKSNEGKSAYAEYLSVRKERRMKEGSWERYGSVKSDKESFRDNSSGTKRSSCSDESVDSEHGGGKRAKMTNQEGGKKQHEREYENDATQNRVRSDFPRHNWLVERWINQKNVPGNEKARSTSAEETRKTNTEDLKDSQGPTSVNNAALDESAVMQTSASPVFEQTYKDEVLDEGYTKRLSDEEIPTDNEIVIAQHESKILKVPSPVKYENDPLVPNNHSLEIKYSPKKHEHFSPRNASSCSPEIKQYSPTKRESPQAAEASPKRSESLSNFSQTSPSRVQISPTRVRASSTPLSPKILQATSCRTNQQPQASPTQISVSPNRTPTSPNRLPPLSPNRFSAPSNCITSSPSKISPQPRNRTPESQRVPASPHRVSSSSTPPSHVLCSPDGRTLPDRAAPSPNRTPTETANTIPHSPHTVPSNIPLPPFPSPVPQSPHRIAPSPNRLSVSPKDKTSRRSSSIGHSFGTEQKSPRDTSERDLGGIQGGSRSSKDRTGIREDSNRHEHIHPGELGLRRESLSGGEEDKIIEVTSDSEESKRENVEENKEVSKIQTGKSVNPVSPIVRVDKHVMDEMHPGIHDPRTQDLKKVRIPAELPPAIPFVGPGYVPGYSPKTFTPQLITHNSTGFRHAGHSAVQGSLPARVELSQHTKPDMNCPYHGKKVEKMHPHVPGYPVLPPDAHMYPQHPLYNKLRDKRSEHLDLPADPIAIQRRLPAVYDRQMVMPHGIQIHHPRYLTPGLIDEHGFPIDSERYKQARLEAVHAYAGMHKQQPHALGGTSVEASRYDGALSKDKRHALKYVQDSRETAKDIGMQSENYRHHHSEHSHMTSHVDRNDITKRYISPQDTRPARAEHDPRTRPESSEIYSQSVRQVKKTHPGYIQLGEGKKEKTGPEPRPSSSPGTLDRESISRDFNERFNMLDKTFKEKLEGTDYRSKEEAIAAYNSHPHRRIDVVGPPRGWSENQARMVEQQARGIDPLKYRNLEKHSPNTKHSSPDEPKKLQDRVSPRGMVTSIHTSPHKATVPIPSYHFHGNLVPNSPHGFGRGMVGVPVMANHGDFGVWQGMRGHPRIPGYSPTTKEIQVVTAEKNERSKPDYAAAKREHQEKERSLAIEKHRMNLAQLENERRKALLAGKTERIDERRRDNHEHERRSPRTREEEMRRELESRKRKLEQSGPEVNISPNGRPQVDVNKRIMTEKSHHLSPDELALRKEYLAMYGRQHEGYGMPGVPYPDRARSAGNPPFYMGRMGSQEEASVNEALRKQRQYNERQEAMRKIAVQERSTVDGGEPVKKKIKNNRCMCGVCGKEASFLCSGCQKAWYCSAKCQHTAWTEHCKECTEAKRR